LRCRFSAAQLLTKSEKKPQKALCLTTIPFACKIAGMRAALHNRDAIAAPPCLNLPMREHDSAFLLHHRSNLFWENSTLRNALTTIVLGSFALLAALKAINPRDLMGETFVAVSNTAPVLRVVVDNFLKRSGVKITLNHEADHLSMGMSLIASTRGVGLLPAYAQNFLPSSLTSRPLKGETPTIELVLGYKKSNKSPILKLLLSRLDELVARVSKRAHG
jgi:DNA-binding transcriptional LysR family regulator